MKDVAHHEGQDRHERSDEEEADGANGDGANAYSLSSRSETTAGAASDGLKDHHAAGRFADVPSAWHSRLRNGWHAWLRALGAFRIENVEAVLQVLIEVLARVEPLRRRKAHVVGIESEGDDEMRTGRARDPVGQIVSVIV